MNFSLRDFLSHSQIGQLPFRTQNFLGSLHSAFLAMRNLASLLLLAFAACSSHGFSGYNAMHHLLTISNIGPHPVGSKEQERVRDYIIDWLQKQGWESQVHPFVYRGLHGYNILACKGEGPGILLGTHYDTRPISDRNPPETRSLPVPGANDGNSGTAVLLELARSLKEPRNFRLWLAFFDAEDRGNIDGWPFSIGALFASQIELDLAAVVIVDMIGDADLQIYQEANSDKALTQSLWNTARNLGFAEYFIPQVKYSIIDDHLPFASKGIPSALLIDFDYPYWHTTEDTPDKVSPKSLEIVGQVLKVWVEEEGAKWIERR